MPELPEVETVARDLRPRLVGATIVGARCSWARTLRTHEPEAFADAVAGREVLAGRSTGQAARHRAQRRRRADRPSQDDRPAVRRAGGRARGSVRPARPRAGRRSGAALPRHPQVRQGRAVRPRSGDRRPRRRGRRGVGLRVRSARSRSTTAYTLRGLPAAAAPPQGSTEVAAPRPVVRRGRRQHLRRRGAVARHGSIRCGRSGPCASPTSATCTRRSAASSAEAVERRGSLDRRLHRARRRRLDAGASWTSTSGPASRASAAGARSGGSSSGPGRRTSARGASGCPGRIARRLARSCAA